MRSFTLFGQQHTEGVLLTVTAPEIGTVTAPASVQGFTQGKVVGLDLGFIQMPGLVCKAKGQDGNARLSLYFSGDTYQTMQVAHLCDCPHNAHPRFYAWQGLQVEGTHVVAGPAEPQEEKTYPPLPPATKAANETQKGQSNATKNQPVQLALIF